ncbi:MAG TPA: LamG-like jellyroll fold domain-containing protein, partial [Acidimicrobiales bacterium]|nr:LamG-like jellyroll fold domain-containing protein [Acidimicrobiales bacterium]
MSPLRIRRGLAAWSSGRLARRDEEGFTLAEMTITVLIVSIVLSMTVVIVSTFFTSAAQTQRVGNATLLGQDAMVRIDQLLRGAVSPLNAQSSNAASSGSKCWGSTNPGPTGIETGDASFVATGWPAAAAAATGGPGENGPPPAPQVSQETIQSLSVIVAHDFDIWFCGYHNSTGNPHVYEITINRSLCQNNDPSGGYCTLQVIDHGPGCVPGSTVGCGSPYPQVVDAINNVWCDQFCQGNNSQTHTGTLYPEVYGSISSTATQTNFALACVDQPPAVQASDNNCTNATPPLFEYYLGNNTAGQGGQCYSSSNCTATPVNAQASTITANNPGASVINVPAPYCTLNCQTPLDLSSSAAQNSSLLSVTMLLAIQLVTVHFTIGAQAQSAQPLLNGGTPGTQLENQVFLSNQLQKGTSSCSYDLTLQSLATPAGNWPMTDTGGTAQVPNVVDTSSNDNFGTLEPNGTPPTENQPAGGGPLACLASSKAMAFDATQSQYIETNQPYCPIVPTTANPTPCPGGTINAANGISQGYTIITWFKTAAVGQAINGGILGFSDAQTTGGPFTNYDREIYLDGSGHLNWEVCPNLGSPHPGSSDCTSATVTPSVATSIGSYNDATWHMAVATIGPQTYNQALQAGGGGQYLYVDGNLQAATTTTAAGAYTGYLTIGAVPGTTTAATPAAGTYFSGDIGRTTILPKVLSPQQVAQLYGDSGVPNSCYSNQVTGAEPLGYYPLSTSTNVVTGPGGVADLAPSSPFKGSAYNGTLNNTAGAPTVPTAANGGPPATCAQQLGALPMGNALGTYVDLGGGSAFGAGWAPGQELTVEAWVDLSDYADPNPHVIANSRTDCSANGFELVVTNSGAGGYFDVGTGNQAGKGAGCTPGSAIQASPDGGVAQWTASGGGCAPSGSGTTVIVVPTICKNQWYFVVGTYDQTNVRVYVDGTQVSETPWTGGVAPPNNANGGAGSCGTCTVNIGRDPQYGGGGFNGYVANVAV